MAPVLTCFRPVENKNKDDSEPFGRNALCIIPRPAIHGRTGDLS